MVCLPTLGPSLSTAVGGSCRVEHDEGCAGFVVKALVGVRAVRSERDEIAGAEMHLLVVRADHHLAGVHDEVLQDTVAMRFRLVCALGQAQIEYLVQGTFTRGAVDEPQRKAIMPSSALVTWGCAALSAENNSGSGMSRCVARDVSVSSVGLP